MKHVVGFSLVVEKRRGEEAMRGPGSWVRSITEEGL